MKKLTPPELIKKRFDKEIKKFSMLDSSSPEYGVTRNYLDILSSIPWGKYSKEELDYHTSKTNDMIENQKPTALA